MKPILALIATALSFALASCECCKKQKSDSCCAEGKGAAAGCTAPGKGCGHKH